MLLKFTELSSTQGGKEDEGVVCEVLLPLHRGNSLVVGSLGQPLKELVSLALYVAGYSLHHIDTHSQGAFRDQMRSLFRLAGLEGKQVAVLVTVSTHDVLCVCWSVPLLQEDDLLCREVANTLTSLISTSELPTLFSNDEMEGLIQVSSLTHNVAQSNITPYYPLEYASLR